jgi:invasin C
MSTAIQAMSSVVPPWRFEARAAVVQPQAGPLEPSASAEAGFDGHVKAPAHLALWLELLALMEEQRAADRALASQVGLVAQSMSREQAEHVRAEGVKIFAGALAGALLGVALGATGAVMSHRALGRQLGNPAAARPGSGSAVPDDIASPSSWFDRLQTRFGTTYQVNPARPSSRGAAELPTGSMRSGQGERSLRNAGAGEPADGNIVPPHPTNALPPLGTADMMRASRAGIAGQMLAGNAASLAMVGATGGQMAAAIDRADAGLLQTSGMISESTKNNRGEEARNGNEAVARTLAALRDQNQDLRQTMSQIAASIRA